MQDLPAPFAYETRHIVWRSRETVEIRDKRKQAVGLATPLFPRRRGTGTPIVPVSSFAKSSEMGANSGTSFAR